VQRYSRVRLGAGREDFLGTGALLII